MKEIRLSQGKVALVDDADFESVKRFKWRCLPAKNGRFYALTQVVMGRLNGKRIRSYMYLHTLIMKPPKGYEVDHKDHDGLNCTRENMRKCTRSQNNANQRKMQKKYSSIYKGVSWAKNKKRWQACIKYRNKQIKIGYFDKEVDAALAYNKKAILIFGDFAYLNNIAS